MLPFWGGTQRLPRLIGRKRALEAILTAKILTAEQAFNYGLLNKVVPAKDVLNEALELAPVLLKDQPKQFTTVYSLYVLG